MKLPKHDPLATQQATSDDINAIRRQLEQKPVVVDGRPYDCRPDDLLRMEAMAMAYSNDTLYWTLADNSAVPIKGKDLSGVRRKILTELGVRMDRLHQIAQDLKANPVSLRDVQITQWIKRLNAS